MRALSNGPVYLLYPAAHPCVAVMTERIQKTIMLDCSKREVFTPGSGLAALRRKLQGQYKIVQNKDTLSLPVLREASLVIFAGPRERFSAVAAPGAAALCEP